MRVCHFTSVHETTDDRIFLKECQSLQKAGYEVYIVGKGESKKLSGIQIVGCGEAKGRIDRFLCFSRKVYKKAKELDCDIYHFHDPELLGYGLKLKREGKKVIFDSHEDVPAQILDKKWLPKFIRRVISICYRKYETYIVKKLDMVVTATPFIKKQFIGRAKRIDVINNYPRLDDIMFHDNSFKNRKAELCYVGGIGSLRGEEVMLTAMEKIPARLVLAGRHEIEKFDVGIGKISYIGQVEREIVNEIYKQSILGIILYQPAENHFFSQPIKLFEYMAAGLPVVCSDFELWKKIIKENEAGICVNPKDVDAVVKAVNYLLINRDVAQKMGENGRKAIEKNFSWKSEGLKLCGLYDSL